MQNRKRFLLEKKEQEKKLLHKLLLAWQITAIIWQSRPCKTFIWKKNVRDYFFMYLRLITLCTRWHFTWYVRLTQHWEPSLERNEIPFVSISCFWHELKVRRIALIWPVALCIPVNETLFISKEKNYTRWSATSTQWFETTFWRIFDFWKKLFLKLFQHCDVQSHYAGDILVRIPRFDTNFALGLEKFYPIKSSPPPSCLLIT